MVFIEARSFTRRLHELAGNRADGVLENIQRDLLQSPQRGTVVIGLAGIRKGRARNPGRSKGKGGGYRYLYLYLASKNHVHLLFLLDKDEQEDLSPQERAILRQLVAEIEARPIIDRQGR